MRNCFNLCIRLSAKLWRHFGVDLFCAGEADKHKTKQRKNGRHERIVIWHYFKISEHFRHFLGFKANPSSDVWSAPQLGHLYRWFITKPPIINKKTIMKIAFGKYSSLYEPHIIATLNNVRNANKANTIFRFLWNIFRLWFIIHVHITCVFNTLRLYVLGHIARITYAVNHW